MSNPMPVLPVFLNDLTPLAVCIERMGSVRMGCVLAELEQRIVLRTQLSEAQNHRCCWCGERFCDQPNRPQSPTLEHVQPLSLQGPNTPDNLAVACARCNRKRGVLAPEIFLAKAFTLGWMGNRTPSPWSPDGAVMVEPPPPGDTGVHRMGRLIARLLVVAVTVTFFLLGLVVAGILSLFGWKRREDMTFEAVPYILDGDSLAFDHDIRIRLYGMDAPEMDHPEGELSKRHLQGLVQGQAVKVVVKEEDKYGRGVAKVYLPNGEDLSARMVADGYARAYASFTSSYVALEKKAKKSKAGLWANNGLALHPELWRKAQR